MSEVLTAPNGNALLAFADWMRQRKAISLARPISKKYPYKREQVELLVQTLLNKVAKLSDMVECAGSYRRLKPVVEDLDFVVLNGSTHTIESLLPHIRGMKVLKRLRCGEFKSAYEVSFEDLKSVQIEFVITNPRSYGACMFQYTGSGKYNIKMRAYAKRHGYLLNDKGLYRDGIYMAGRTELEIFKALGTKYLAPQDRGNLVPFLF